MKTDPTKTTLMDRRNASQPDANARRGTDMATDASAQNPTSDISPQEMIETLGMESLQLRDRAAELEELAERLLAQGGDSAEVEQERSQALEMLRIADAVDQTVRAARFESPARQQKMLPALMGQLTEIKGALTRVNAEVTSAEAHTSAVGASAKSAVEAIKAVAEKKETPKPAAPLVRVIQHFVSPPPVVTIAAMVPIRETPAFTPVTVVHRAPSVTEVPLQARMEKAMAAAQHTVTTAWITSTDYVSEKASAAKLWIGETVQSLADTSQHAASAVAESVSHASAAVGRAGMRAYDKAAGAVSTVGAMARGAADYTIERVSSAASATGHAVMVPIHAVSNGVSALWSKLPFVSAATAAPKEALMFSSAAVVSIAASPGPSAMSRAVEQAMSISLPGFAGGFGLDTLGDLSVPMHSIFSMPGWGMAMAS